MALQFYLQDTNEAIITEDTPFASGGEGNLYTILRPSRFALHVAKIIHPHKRNAQREAKIQYLVQNRPDIDYSVEHQSIIWVEAALYNEQSQFVGFIMPRANGEKLEILCAPRFPKHLGSAWQRFAPNNESAMRLRLLVCYNLAVAVQQLHATGKYVLVDLKPDNVIISPDGLISLVDTDSIEVIANNKTLYPATVATPEYTPAEYYNAGLEPSKSTIPQSWDNFSLAVIFYRILLGIHPFAASCRPPYDALVSLSDKIKYGLFVHDAGKRNYFTVVPPPHAQFARLDEEIQNAFLQTFDAGHDTPEQRVSAAAWAQTLKDSPYLLIDRPLPSQKIAIPDFSKENWFELAVEASTRAVPTREKERSFQEDLLERFKNFTPVQWALLIIGGLAGVSLLGRMLRIFFKVGMPLLVIAGIIFWFVSNNKNKKRRKSIKNRGVHSRKALEKIQHQLFSQRIEIKNKLRQAQTELNVIEQVMRKRVREFQQKHQQETNAISQSALAAIQMQAGNTNYDRTAQQLIRQEAAELKQLRLDAKYGADKTELEAQEQAIRAHYAELHQQLLEEAQAYKQTLEETRKIEIDKIQERIKLTFNNQNKDLLTQHHQLNSSIEAQNAQLEELNDEIQSVRDQIANLIK